MKSGLFGFTALAALAATGAAAADQAPATPAGLATAPQPSLQEELVYLRDIIALQTLRLDEAEQALTRQTKALDEQQKRIADLERALANGGGRAVLAADMKGDYTVKSGDTLGLIAQRHGVALGDLAAANGLKSPYRIDVGQRLAVPGAAPAEDATAAAKVAARTEDKAKPIEVASADTPGPSPGARPDVTERALKEQREGATETTAPPQEVGVRPEDEDDRPEVSVLPDVGGILTPKGSFYVEPSFDYTVTSDNRFFFQGVEIVDAILIGVIEATDSDRRGRTASLAARYGITDRLEVDGRFSWVNRKDRISGVAIDDGTTIFRELSGDGLGDAEVGVHYQLTSGKGFPFTVLNMRAKAPTGTGPFDVGRDARGIETELATGSGYWSIEPSVTFILPTDPAVIFANIGYQFNMSDTPDALIGPNTIVREFNPGDAIRASIGMGLAVNDRFSLSFGYDQSNFFGTSTVLESVASGVQSVSRQQPTAVGSFLIGGSYTLNDRIRLNLNTAFGATDEAPDMRVSLRAQVRLFD